MIFNLSKNHQVLRNVIYAKVGWYGGRKWHIQGKRVYPKRDQVTRAYTIDLPLNPHDIMFASVRKRYQPIWVLWNQYESEYWFLFRDFA